MNILVIQYKINYLKIESNLEKFQRILKKYFYLKPDLVVFPEYSLTGPLYSNYQLSLKENNDVIPKLCLLAKKFKVNLIPGSFIRKIDNFRYNSTCIISKKGEVSGYYDKQNLWGIEKLFLKAGKETPIFKINNRPIAIQICADLHSSILSHKYRQLEPQIIVNLSFWSHEDTNACSKYVPSNLELLQTTVLARARAIENKSYVIYCNYADRIKIQTKTGRIYQTTSIGNSMIINPYGEVIAKSSSNKEEVLCARIDLTKCHWASYVY